VNHFLWFGSVRGYGFSGVVSSFVGALIFAYVLFLHKTLKVNSLYAYASSVTFVALLFIITYFTFAEITIAIMFFIIVYFVWTTYKTMKSIDLKAKNELIEKKGHPVVVNMLPLNLYLLILFFSLSLFPAQFIQGNMAINFLIHYEGLIIGLGMAYLIHDIDSMRTKKEN
jgi:large-conductance mechanosensitive channel